MLKITSRDNQRLKHARKVFDGKVKEAIFVEGARLAEEVLRSDLRIFDVFNTESFRQTERGKSFLEKIQSKNINCAEVSEKIFNSLSDTKNSQGVIVIAGKPETGKKILETKLEKEKKQFPILVLLHEINNPANLGAILRTAEAADVSCVITTKTSANVFSPKTLRGAMGAVFRLPIWTDAEFFEVIEWAKEKNFTTVCADVNAEKSYLEINWKKPRLLIFGSEAHGLSDEERAVIDESLVIPMENSVESLNLAVSCGIILFEARRQNNH